VLRLSELLAEKKPFAKLIVLSACETGTGQLYKGEGVFSFNRGFAALGIPSSVSNLWSVDNLSTYHLTELFYKYLARGLPMDEALQKAKLEFMQESPKEKALPFYWAGAILAGKTDPIQLKKSASSTFIVLSIIVSCCTLVFAYALWSRRRRISS
jgi:CHAT domain-containing protein